MRILAVSVLVVAGLAGLAGCGGAGTQAGTPSDTHAAALAAAECASAVHDELGLTDADTVRTSEVDVTGNDAERRLEGRWEVTDAGQGVFTCVVVPDDSDELRGLRVTDLEVRRARDPGA